MKPLLVVFGLTLAFVGAAKLAGITIPASDSMPRGIWQRYQPQSIETGMVVVFCPAQDETFQPPQGWQCPHGVRPVLKPVAAIAGDLVDITNNGVSVNGLAVPGTARQAIPPGTIRVIPEGRYQVNEGEIWLLSNYHPRGLDSRYYGPVLASRIDAAARPLLLFK